MSRKFDIILFGATGFTGQHTIPQLNKFCNTDGKSLKWAVAGRSEKKLKDVLEKVGNEIGKYRNIAENKESCLICNRMEV